ncbi:MAG TPA: alcohol dehydrogenase catalytic domain-containing protein, partial [bacterium]|nr:alcohol dehydrogenase catalytic domain-containing protein [bacterium]
MRQAKLIGASQIGFFHDAPVPEPKPGTARVRIKAVGICGSDKHLFLHGKIGETQISEPFVIGHEAMGVVDAVGEGVVRNLVGRRVAIEPAIPCHHCECCIRGDMNLCLNIRFLGHPPTPGAFQEFIIHPADLLEPVPDSVTDAGAVMLEPLAVVVHAFDLGRIRFGSRVAVLGCGPIGLLAVWTARMLQPSVLLATDILDYRLDVAKSLGASHVGNPSRQDIVAHAREITQGKGFDTVIEAATSDDTGEQMTAIAGAGAKILIIGITLSDRISFCHATARRKGLTFFMVRRSRNTL